MKNRQNSTHVGPCIYLAQLNVFGYELTAIGRTREEARNAIKEVYERKQDHHGPLDDNGNMRTFADYEDFAPMNIHETLFGHVEWL
tara:strand:+ start:50722 stop:50979 length:258 start_codon:yes stop_codon:yes gene_type:complete